MTCLEPMAEPDQAADADTWADKIGDALNCGERHPLALAEEAVRTCPGDYTLLCLAATAALIEEPPDRAQLYLKRLRKRYEPGQHTPSCWPWRSISRNADRRHASCSSRTT